MMNKYTKITIVIGLFFLLPFVAHAQYPPPGLFQIDHDRDSSLVQMEWLEPLKSDWVSYNNDIEIENEIVYQGYFQI